MSLFCCRQLNHLIYLTFHGTNDNIVLKNLLLYEIEKRLLSHGRRLASFGLREVDSNFNINLVGNNECEEITQVRGEDFPANCQKFRTYVGEPIRMFASSNVCCLEENCSG